MQVLVKYKNELNELITRLAAARTASSDGKIGFAASEFELITSVLESAIDFQPVIPQADRRGLIRDALFATGREAKPDAKLLEDHLKRCEVGYLQRPLQAYVLASAMGIRNYYGRTRIRINGVEVSFHKSLPTKFNRTEIGEQIAGLDPAVPPSMVQVLARVSARTPIAAFEDSKESIDLLRGLWCYTMQFRNFVLFRIGPPRPVNVILPGPLHTLHRPDGLLIKDVFWYEPQGLTDHQVHDADQKWSTVQKRGLGLLSRLRAIKYRNELETAFVRYVRALDSRDHGGSFGGIWSVLEYVTDSVGEYDRLIRRVAFLFGDKDRRFVRLLLEHLRDVRNRLVHAAEVRSNMEIYLYQLKGIAELMIRYHLRRGNRYTSLANAAEYLERSSWPRDNRCPGSAPDR